MSDAEEEIQFVCEMCGKHFEPTPDAMVEWNLEPCTEEDEGAVVLTPEDIENAGPEQLERWGLTPEMLEALARGETAKTGGCICLACQDQMAAE